MNRRRATGQGFSSPQWVRGNSSYGQEVALHGGCTEAGIRARLCMWKPWRLQPEAPKMLLYAQYSAAAMHCKGGIGQGWHRLHPSAHISAWGPQGMLVVVLIVPFSKIIIQSIIGQARGGHLRRRLHLSAHLPPKKLPKILLRAGRARSVKRLCNLRLPGYLYRSKKAKSTTNIADFWMPAHSYLPAASLTARS